MKNVNIIIGKFQPFTLGHLKLIQSIEKDNDLPIVVLVVRRSKPILSDAITKKMLDALMKAKVFYDYMFVKNGFLSDNFDLCLENNYYPQKIIAGADRIDDYEKQFDKYIAPKIDTPVEFLEVDRPEGDISATKVRDFISSGDLNSAKKLLPSIIYPLLNNIQKELI